MGRRLEMNRKSWILGLVAGSFLLVFALEFWTFSEMIWRGIAGERSEHQSVTKTTSDPGVFTIDGIHGRFDSLELRIGTDHWILHGEIHLENRTEKTRTFTVNSIRLESGGQQSLAEEMTLEPQQKKTMRINSSISPGANPKSLMISFAETPQKNNQIPLPKVPAKSQ